MYVCLMVRRWLSHFINMEVVRDHLSHKDQRYSGLLKWNRSSMCALWLGGSVTI